MRKTIGALAAVLILSMAAPATAQEVGPSQVVISPNSWRWDECRFQGVFAPKWTQLEEEWTARCAIRHWPIPGGFAKLDQVISCESGWNRYAVSSSGTYVGLAQHSRSYWYGRFRTFSPARWTMRPAWSNSRTHLVVTVRMVHAGGWAPWSCA